jgi:hypothetical protein
MIFLFLFYYSFTQAKAETCGPTNPQICDSQASSARGNDDFQAAYKYDRMGCDYNCVPCCSQLYNDKPSEETKNYLLKRCTVNDEICGSVANIFYQEKNIEKAHALDRKYFLKYNRGAFPLKLYEVGQNKEAFELALASCEKDQSKCSFYIRYMPDHPQLTRFLGLSDKYCRENNNDLGGATTCALLGSYFYKNKNHKKALELWKSECVKIMDSSCRLIIGSDATSASKLEAFHYLCSSAHKPIGCLPASQTLPSSIINESEKLLKSYLSEQKTDL